MTWIQEPEGTRISDRVNVERFLCACTKSVKPMGAKDVTPTEQFLCAMGNYPNAHMVPTPMRRRLMPILSTVSLHRNRLEILLYTISTLSLHKQEFFVLFLGRCRDGTGPQRRHTRWQQLLTHNHPYISSCSRNFSRL